MVNSVHTQCVYLLMLAACLDKSKSMSSEKSDLVLLLPQLMTLSLNIYDLHVTSRARALKEAVKSANSHLTYGK